MIFSGRKTYNASKKNYNKGLFWDMRVELTGKNGIYSYEKIQSLEKYWKTKDTILIII
jgi:hypothetical protein